MIVNNRKGIMWINALIFLLVLVTHYTLIKIVVESLLFFAAKIGLLFNRITKRSQQFGMV